MRTRCADHDAKGSRMFDTMTMTKVVGAFCGALLIYLLGNWVGEILYHSHGPEEQAYVIDTGEDDTVDAEPEVEVDILTMVASANPDDGARVFRQCSACHNIEEPINGAGPHLDNVMGRAIGSISDFNYSGALPEGEWTPENLDPWLENPSAFAAGTSMGYAGLRDKQDRADLIAYMIQYSPEYVLPAAAPADAAPAAEDDAAAPAEDDAAAPAEEATTDTAAAEDTPVEEAPAEATEAPAEEGATDLAAAPAPEAAEPPAAEAPAADAAPAEATSAIAAAYETADVAAGQRIFRQCQACHVADQEQNRVGPHLVGLLGRTIGSVEGFRYSGNLPEGEWTLENLDAWLENPRAFAPGTSMAYGGLDDVQERADVIAYIESL